jgi:thiol:disulfide interchange protein DsbD
MPVSFRQFPILLLAAFAVSAGSAVAQDRAPKAKVSLVPSTTGIMPGQPFDVAIQFELTDPWHIYWKNSGDSGLPPHVTWKVPVGFTVGELKFPVPKRRVSPGDIVTNIHSGSPILTATLTPPLDIGTGKVTIGADIKYLVCAENCIREDAQPSFEVPSLPAGSTPEPANANVFKRAARAQPQSTSKYLTIDAGVTTPLMPGTHFEVVLNVEIKPGFHIQSHQPSQPTLIPAEVFIEPVDGVRFLQPKFPKGKTRTDPNLGQLSEYDGKIVIRVPAEVASDAQNLPARIAGIFAYQACKETCFPPEGVTFAADTTKTALVAPGGEEEVAGRAEPSGSRSGLEPDVRVSDSGEQGGLEGFFRRFGIVGLLVGCFLYGLFINATPCVLPLLSIKVFGFVQQAHSSRGRALALGLAFGVGVIIFFIVLGLLAAQGKNVLQSPVAVVVLGAVVLALSLSMLGVYTLQVPVAATHIEARIHSEGLLSSFAKGALAPVLGFACTGPLLAGAWGWAVKQEPKVAVIAFAFAGLGMAAPYMLLGANPKWLGFLPKPGNWMITFERVMGFLLLAMVIWLIHPLTKQLGTEGFEWTLIFYVAVAFACWTWGRVDFNMADRTRLVYRSGAMATVGLAAVLVYGWALRPVTELEWRPWSPQAVEETVRAGKLAFVDFTAAYCTVCKVNKRVAINTDEVMRKLDRLDAVAFQGDFSNGDERIFEILQKYERGGVPLDLIYPPGRPDAPLVLSANLTKDYLLQKLDEAARSGTATASMAP